MTKITSCAYYQNHQYVIAICHNTPVNFVKAKLLSTNLLNITSSNILIIRDSIETEESPEQIIEKCLDEAASLHRKLNATTNNILEVVYFGDVNLTKQGSCEYPSLLLDQEKFSTIIKANFLDCLIIKRILVSADQPVIDDAKIRFSQPAGQNLALPPIIDSFVSKSYRDLYTEIHLIDSGLINAMLNYHQSFLPEKDENLSVDDFSKIETCIERVRDKLGYLLGRKGHPLTFAFISQLQHAFYQHADHYSLLTNAVLSEQKSTIFSLAFSYLIPASLRTQIMSNPGFENIHYAIISIGEMKHHDLGESFGMILKETKEYFGLYFQTSDLMMTTAQALLKKLQPYKYNKELAPLGFVINYYDYLTPKIKSVFNDLIEDLALLLKLLPNKSVRLHQVENHSNYLSQKINLFVDEALRKKTLSNKSFFASKTHTCDDSIYLKSPSQPNC